MSDSSPTTVVVTGANGLVGSRLCAALAGRGAEVRAVVRRAGTAPALSGVHEVVGDFTDPAFSPEAVAGADAVVTTVHPMGTDLETQVRVGVEGTLSFARAAADAGVPLLVHVSTCAVYQRVAGVGDVDENAEQVGDDAGDYPVTKRDLDVALAGVDGITRVLVRPPAILGPSETSLWNTLRPAAMVEDEDARRADPTASWPWVHVDDLATFLAGVALGVLGGAPAGECTPVNVAGRYGTWRDYVGTVANALGVHPEWDSKPVWTGRIVTDRARSWGWEPTVTLSDALAELRAGLVRAHTG